MFNKIWLVDLASGSKSIAILHVVMMEMIFDAIGIDLNMSLPVSLILVILLFLSCLCFLRIDAMLPNADCSFR